MRSSLVVAIVEGRKWIIEIAMAGGGALTAGFQSADRDVEAGIAAGATRLSMAALAGLDVHFCRTAVIDWMFPRKTGVKRRRMDHEGRAADVAGIAANCTAVAFEIDTVADLATDQVCIGCVAMGIDPIGTVDIVSCSRRA